LGSIVAGERESSDEIAATFSRMTATRSFVAEWQLLKVPHVNLAPIVMEHGRAADLIIAGQTDPDWDLSPLLDFPERLHSKADARCYLSPTPAAIPGSAVTSS